MYREGQGVCPLPHRLSCVRDESLQDVSNGSNKHQTRVLSLPKRMCERAHARTMVWVGGCRVNPACCAMSTLHRHDWRSFQPPHVGTPLPPFYLFALWCNIPLCISQILLFFPHFFSFQTGCFLNFSGSFLTTTFAKWSSAASKASKDAELRMHSK